MSTETHRELSRRWDAAEWRLSKNNNLTKWIAEQQLACTIFRAGGGYKFRLGDLASCEAYANIDSAISACYRDYLNLLPR